MLQQEQKSLHLFSIDRISHSWLRKPPVISCSLPNLFAMSDLYLAVDTGGSQTKVIFQLDSHDRPHTFTMPPQIEQVPKNRLQHFFERQGWIGNPAPQQRAWVEWDNQVFILGDFAQKFNPEDRLKERKYENTLYKVLAAVGVIVADQRDLIKRRKLTVSLAVLLPWNEYSDRDLFKEQLTWMLQAFSFQDCPIKVKLDLLMCRPEGGGLAATFLRQRGAHWLREKQLGVLMFGHRNTTALHFANGELKVGDSPLLGFSVLLDHILEHVGGLDREALTLALAQGMVKPTVSDDPPRHGWKKRASHYPDWQTLPQIQALAFSRNPSLRTKEIDRLAEAIELATQTYWQQLENWLKRVLPNHLKLDEVLIGGGSATYLKPLLEKYFNSCLHLDSGLGTQQRAEFRPMLESSALIHSTPINWGDPFQQQAKKLLAFSKTQDEAQSLSVRFLDCFGLFDYLLANLST
jgi:hypothetical protein